MKIKDLDEKKFQIEKKVNFDISLLKFEYGEKEIFDVLKQNVLTPGYLNKCIKATPTNNHQSLIDFNYYQRNEINNCYYNFYYTLMNSVSNSEKEFLLDLALEQKDLRFASALISNPEVKLSEKQFNLIYNNKSHDLFNLKETLIKNKNIPLSMEQINEGLLDFESRLAETIAQRGESCILKKTIDELINSDYYLSEDILVEILKHQNVHFDEYQIKFCLESDNFFLKLACAKNYSFPFTKKQILQGLEDEGFERDLYDDKYDGVKGRG